MPTRRSIARKALRKGFLPPVPRKATQVELLAVEEMNRVINGRNWELSQIKANTALVPDGQKLVEQLEATVSLLENACRYEIGQILIKCGYAPDTKCDLNLTTGEIILHGPEDVK